MSYNYRFNIDQYRRIAGNIASRFGSRPVTVFEIGSRDAADAFLLLTLLPLGSRVHCFDPHPLFMQLSAPFASASSSLRVENLALSETAGPRSFYLTNTPDIADICEDAGIGASSLKKPIANVAGLPTTGFIEVAVTCVRGEDYCASSGVVPDALILDVQGAEVEVLMSFGSGLDKVGLVFTECNMRSGITYENDSAASDVISCLQGRGFSLFSAYNISRYSADLVFSRDGGAMAAGWVNAKLKLISGLKGLVRRLA